MSSYQPQVYVIHNNQDIRIGKVYAHKWVIIKMEPLLASHGLLIRRPNRWTTQYVGWRRREHALYLSMTPYPLHSTFLAPALLPSFLPFPCSTILLQAGHFLCRLFTSLSITHGRVFFCSRGIFTHPIHMPCDATMECGKHLGVVSLSPSSLSLSLIYVTTKTLNIT